MFELFKSDKSGEFYFRLKAKNGEIILSSEGYEERAKCQSAIESAQKHAADEKNFQSKAAAGGKHYFSLKAANGQAIGKSQMYATASGLKNGIASVQKNAPTATVNDLTASAPAKPPETK